MLGEIKDFNFMDITAMRYWSFPSSYSVEKKKEQLNTMLYSGNYVASEKRDGYWQMVLKDDDGNVKMRARAKGVNGWICKEEWVPHLNSFFDELPNGTCLICEVYLPGKTSKTITTILGCGKEKAIERQAGSHKLRLSVFDVLAYDGLLLYSRPIVDRIAFLDKLRNTSNEYVDVVTYWSDPDEIHENWLKILDQGGEGVVLTKKDYPYQFGSRTARKTLKLKKELQETIDAFLTGNWKEPTKLYTGKELETWPYWYNEVTGEKVKGTPDSRIYNNELTPVTRLWFNGWAAALEVASIIDGKVTPIGWISGISDEVKESIAQDEDSWKGKVVELQAMEVAYDKGHPTLRHAKIVAWRPDKTWKDCEWVSE